MTNDNELAQWPFAACFLTRGHLENRAGRKHALQAPFQFYGKDGTKFPKNCPGRCVGLRDHSILSASLNGIVRSSLPVESRTRISPVRKHAFRHSRSRVVSPGTLVQRLAIQKPSSQYGAQDTDRRCSDWKFLGRSGSHCLYERPCFGDFWSILIGLLP
jgi:hypothetical protein